MTVTEVIPISGPYNGNDVLDEFDYTFFITDETELVVTLADTDGIETVQTITTHYTVTRNSETGKGIFTMVTPPATDEKVSATLDMPVNQTTNLRNKGPFFAETHEIFFDKSVRIMQQLKEILSRCLRVGVTSGVDPDSVVVGNLVTEEVLDLRAPRLLGEATSGTERDVTSINIGDYEHLRLEIVGLQPDGASSITRMRFTTSGVGSWESNLYDTLVYWKHSGTNGAEHGPLATADLTSGAAVNTGAANAVSGHIDIFNVASGLAPRWTANLSFGESASPHPVLMYVAGQGAALGADLLLIRLEFSSDDVAAGTVRLWGMPTGS